MAKRQRPVLDPEADSTETLRWSEGAETLRWDENDEEARTLDATGASPAPNDPSSTLERDLLQRLPVQREGHYRRGELLGTGGQARVLLASDLFLGRDVAVKELQNPRDRAHPRPAPSTGAPLPTLASVRFLREARITGQLEHPNIVPVYELGQKPDGTPYYTMRLVRGRSLAKALEDCETATDRMALLGHMLDMCNAIAFAHDRRVIHRDIKPANVMVGEFGETVLLDWGVAKIYGEPDRGGPELARQLSQLRGDDSGQTVDGTTIGTPPYMSPEQATGDVAAIDERTDTWGLGAVLYQLLTGKTPHTGSSALEVLYNVAKKPVRPVRELNPEAPPELAAIADKALRRDKRQRYSTALEFAEDLRAYMTGARVTAYEYSSWELARRFARQNRRAIVAATAILVTILVALIAVSVAYRDERDARAVAEQAKASEHTERMLASYYLSQAYMEKAERLAKDHESVAEVVLVAAALRDDPAHSRSPLYDPGFGEQHPGAVLHRARALGRLATLGEVTQLSLVRAARARHPAGRVNYSPDGSTLAAGTSAGELLLWHDHDPTAPVACPLGKGKGLWEVVYSPDGGRIVTGSSAGHLFVLDSAGAVLSRTEAHSGSMRGAAFSPDGRFLATSGNDGSIARWAIDPDTGQARLQQRLDSRSAWLGQILYSPDHAAIAVSTHVGDILLWRVDAAGAVATHPRTILHGDGSAPSALAFAPDGSWLAAGSSRGGLTLVDPGDGRELGHLPAHQGAILDLDVSADGSLLVSAGADERVRLWSVAEDGDELTLLLSHRAHSERIMGVAFSPDGTEIATAGRDGAVRRWRVIPRQPPTVLSGHTEKVMSLAISGDGRTLVSGSRDHTVRVWDTTTGEVVHELHGHTSRVYAVALSPDSSLIASSGRDRTVRLWSATSGEELAVIDAHTANIWALAFSADGRALATGAHDKRLVVWDLGEDARAPTTRTVIDRSAVESNFVWSVAFSPDGSSVASTGGAGFEVVLFDAGTGEHRRSFAGHSAYPHTVQFSPDGRLLLSAAQDGLALIWDVTTGEIQARLEGHEQYINSARFSRDGSAVLTVADDAAAIVWDTSSGQPHLIHSMPTDVPDGCFTPDGDALWVTVGDTVRHVPLDWSIQQADPLAMIRDAAQAAGQHLDGFELVVDEPTDVLEAPEVL